MKKILITVSAGFASRNILRSGVLARILKNGDKVILLCPEEKADYYQKEFGSENVKAVGVNGAIKEGAIETLARFFARNATRTEIVLSLQKEHLLADFNPVHLAQFFIKRLAGFAGIMPGFYNFVRFIDSHLVRRKNEVAEILKQCNPDIVFATHVIDDFDVSVLREAKRLDLKTVGMVRSWDNLTGHGIVRILPDKLLVHSSWLYNLAKDLHKISEKKLAIVGIPQYDTFFRKDFLVSRGEFLASLDLKPDAKIVLFSAISTDFAPYEWEIPQIINDAIDYGDLPKNLMVIARPHPNCGVPNGQEPKGRYVKIDTPAKYIGAGPSGWEQEERDINHFANLMYHADVVVTGASTISMDAAIFNRPIINYAFDGYHKLPYHKSVLRCYEKYTHYMAMVNTRGVKLAYSPSELIAEIRNYLNRPELDHELRQRIVDEFIGYTDGKSAERTAESILTHI